MARPWTDDKAQRTLVISSRLIFLFSVFWIGKMLFVYCIFQGKVSFS